MIAAGLCLWLFAGSAASAQLTTDEVRELEHLLVLLGFDPGPVDGVVDARTRKAIEAYQSFAALRVDGVASDALLEELRGVTHSLNKMEEKTPVEAAAANPAGTAAPDGKGTPAKTASETPAAPPTAPSDVGAAWDTAIHLASFKQESKAHEEWQRLQRRLPDLLGDLTPLVREVDLGDKGVFYRLYAGPFPNLATAQDFCVMVNLEGFDCAVAHGEALRIASTGTPATTGAGQAGTADSGNRPAAKAAAAAAEEQPPPAPEPAATGEQPPPEQNPAPPDQRSEAVPPAGPDTAATPSIVEAKAAAEPVNAPQPSAAGEITVVAPPLAAPQMVGTDEPAAAGPAEEGTAPSPLPPIAPAVPVKELVPHAAVGAPTVLVAETQAAKAPPGGSGPEATGRPAASAGASVPTLLVAPTKFADSSAGDASKPEPETPGAAEAPTAPSAPTLVLANPPAEAGNENVQSAALTGAGADDYAAAVTAFDAGDCEGALRHYSLAFAKGGLPRRALADGYNNRGRCFFDQSHYDEALADFDRAIALDGKFAAAYYNRSRTYNARGDSARAEADLNAAYKLGFGRLDSKP